MSEYKILKRTYLVNINGEYFCDRSDIVLENCAEIKETTDYYKADEWDEFVKQACNKTYAFTQSLFFNKDEIIFDDHFLNHSAKKSHFQNGEISTIYEETDRFVSISDIIKRFDHQKALAYLLQEFNKIKENNDEQ